MIDVTFDQLQAWIAAFLWPFVRLAAFIMAAPLWGHDSIPRQSKIALAALLAYVIAPSLPPLPEVPLVSWASLGIIVEQMLIGIAIGMVMRVTLAVVMAAGEYIGLQMGLAFATFFSSDIGANTMVLSRFLYMITLLMLLAFNAHLVVIEILADSFTTLPIGPRPLNPEAFEMIVRYGGTVFEAGMLLALPVVAALLIINLSLGILNRASPQLTIFSIGFPMTLTTGLILLAVLMTDLGRFLETLLQNGFVFMRQMLSVLAG
ncbi:MULTISPECIES: flagellar biosynthetic protein FliR [Modicisalibacter]|uniref:flagellar biosynthetic protein FliR n=1 Tax=Modicisalibacter TaxID=574347 RepID=UPI00100A71A4|nr:MULTISPECIES: flagellar biosynthetic protein FliR [Halomonadaceae]MBZ9556988.1 flagellar biosynthetic protein FliR [Modicisalibacter sp. R2A 31.J]MBZ9574298.1 flagellar biosynthetic protein FliR [Modicisalibacter sp. MOD 31.J]